jgi:hypothetical protein
MNIVNAAQEYPRVFAVLREHGWRPDLVVDLPKDHIAEARECGFALHDEAEFFLSRFAGIRIRYVRTPGAPSTLVVLAFSLDNLPTIMQVKYHLVVDKITGSNETYPVMNTGSHLVFMYPDGRVMALLHDFSQMMTDDNIFGLLHYVLFKEPQPGFRSRFLREDEKPFEFRVGV